ncbi:UvrD-helicase domain-containing protein [Peribacillus sp. NPDC058002]|uniref:UvrD-helicase domain-containing protein n=1 Tax=Peribacillus sp. NPDC058002 TaxID=3346301 RepID=UPI0036D81DB8
MRVSLEDWIPKGEIILEENAMLAVKQLNNSLVVAGPGAGKTELLAQKACFLLETNMCRKPRKILAISFKKDAAENLKKRVDLRVGNELGIRFVSKTFDSFAKNIVDHFISAIDTKYRPGINYEIATTKDIVSAYAYFKIFPLKGEKRSDFIKRIEAHLYSQILPIRDNELLENVWDYLIKEDDNNPSKLTFTMISYIANYILKSNPLILKSLQQTYSHVFLDEFQDTTSYQYELVKTCFLTSRAAITAVGDNRQRIMVWAGAKTDIFETYINDFKTETYSLLMNHRSAPRLLEIQKVVNNYLQEEAFVPIASSKWSKEDGIAELWYFENYSEEASAIASKIRELIVKNEISPNEICILVKQTVDTYAREIIKELKSLEIEARNEAIFQDLLKEPVVILIIDTIKSSFNVKDSDAWLNILDIKMSLLGKKGTTLNGSVTIIVYTLKSFLTSIKNNLIQVAHFEEFRGIISDIINFYELEKIKKIYPQYAQGNFINQLTDNVANYLYQYYLKKSNWFEAINSFEGKTSIPIMTIHKSKGLEYEAVFFVGFEDEAFWKFTEQANEDTCTFFVALSRAKSYLYFTFADIRNGSFCNNTIISPLYDMLRESKIVEEITFNKG